MATRHLAALLLGALLTTAALADDSADRQAELDRKCEAARAEKLAPIRDDVYRECMADKRGDEAYCRRQADSYNGTRIGGAPRFYELPECQAAFEFRKRGK